MRLSKWRHLVAFTLALASLFVTLPVFAGEQIYMDSVSSGWEGWMWNGVEGTDFNFNSADPIESDTAIWVRYLAGDSLEFHSTGGFDTSGYDTLSFVIHGGSQEGQDIRIFVTEEGKTESNVAVHLTDYVGQISAGSWTEVSIPLSDLGLTNTDAVSLINFRSINAGTVYYDDIRFEKSAGGNSGEFVFFGDATASNVSYLHWNFTRSVVSSSPHQGTSALKFADKNFSDPFGTIWILADGASPVLDTYEAMEFAIRTDQNINASVLFLDGTHTSRRVILGNYLPSGRVTTSWQVAHVPLVDLITGPAANNLHLGNKEGIYLQFSHDGPFTVYLDHVRMVGGGDSGDDGGQCAAPQVLGYSENATPMATLSTGEICSPSDLERLSYFFFDEDKTPATERWGWNVTENTEVSSPVYNGEKAIKVKFNASTSESNSGVQFYSWESLLIESSQYIIFAMKGEVDPSKVNIALAKEDGTSIPGAWVSTSEYMGGCSSFTNWCEVIIPMSAFTGKGAVLPAKSRGFSIESWEQGTEYFDEIRVVGMDKILEFPIEGSNPNEFTPYNTEVYSVLDHHIDGGYYHKDGVIETVGGIARSAMDGCRHFTASGSSEPCSADPNAWNYYGKYSGLIGYTNENPLNLPFDYLDDDPLTGVLWYDGHSGYDYGVTGTFRSATAGILCVSTSDTTQAGGTPWRNPNMCPVGNDNIVGTDDEVTTWDAWHAVYIVYRYDHRYQTWYLHAESLSSSVMSDILDHGYSIVIQGQPIGTVGHCCDPNMGTHLHFELRKNGAEVDPYTRGKENDFWLVN